MTNKIKSIIFDMDGTLLDSSYALTCSVNYVRETLGLGPVEKEMLEYYINEPNQNLAKIFYGTQEYNPEHKELFAKHYLKNANNHVTPYEGVYDFLEFLYQKDIVLSIATNAADIFARNMLKGQGMLDFFSFIVGANNVEHSKPHPDMLEHISKLSSIPLSQSILVGDSVKDEGASINANVDFMFAKWGYGKAQNAKNQFENIKELQDYLERIL
ncbi:HAD family hydrolase [Sulfurospirillum arcachonense]|uniref:HAD family hydrolase n=1 Tax=Sulfurospirillum arcachonense TaxID=57666 RepID=UPI00046ABFC3|nr:HAD family hydrolase [Sulfurospirillum arcachonense]